MLAAVGAEFERQDKGPLGTDVGADVGVGAGVGAADASASASVAMSEEEYLTHLMRQEHGVWASCDCRLHGVVDNVFGSFSNPNSNPKPTHTPHPNQVFGSFSNPNSNPKPTHTPHPNQHFGSFFFAWIHPAGLAHVQETKRTSAFKVVHRLRLAAALPRTTYHVPRTTCH